MRGTALINLNKDVTACKVCKSLAISRKNICLGYGDCNARIIFVGLAPGKDGADLTGVPFTRDPSGRLFQEAMIYIGFSKEDDPSSEKPMLKGVYVTNLVKCNPKDAKGNNRDPSKTEIANCMKHLQKEINALNPVIVVLFGKTVTESLLGIKIRSMKNNHGKEVYANNRAYLPFIHPSYVIRGAYNRDKYITELSESINQLLGQKLLLHKKSS